MVKLIIYLTRWISGVIFVLVVLGRAKNSFLHSFEHPTTLVLFLVCAILAALLLVIIVVVVETTVNRTVAVGGLKFQGAAVDVETPVSRRHLAGNDLVVLEKKLKT